MSRSKPHKLAIFIGVWLLLFIATFLVRQIWNTDQAAAAETAYSAGIEDHYEILLKEATRIKLTGIPTASGTGLTALNAEEFPHFEAVLTAKLRSSNDQLYDCLSETISNSYVRTNFLEFSFSLIEGNNLNLFAQASSATKTVTLSDVVLERSTIQFTAAEKACFLKNLKFEDLESETRLGGRTSYVLCINRRLNPKIATPSS